MNEPRGVPRIELGVKHIPSALLLTWRCHICDHPVAGMGERAVLEAMDAHTAYVNATADRAVDAHFLEVRLDELLRA